MSDRVERVLVTSLLGDCGEPESWKIGCDDSIAVSKTRNQFAVLKRRCREAMQQEHHRSVRWASFSEEDSYSVCLNAMDGSMRHVGVIERGPGSIYRSLPNRYAQLIAREANRPRKGRAN